MPKQPAPPAGCLSIEPGPAGSHGLSLSAAQLRKLSRATDTLSVAWLRGGFGRDAGASSAGFRDQIERLDDVYADAQPSGVSPPRARALSRECYAYHIRLFLGRLWDHSKDSCMSLFHPFAHSHLN